MIVVCMGVCVPDRTIKLCVKMQASAGYQIAKLNQIGKYMRDREKILQFSSISFAN